MIDLSDSLEITAQTHVGLKRDYNEDSIGADSAYGMALVADGMGGHNAGEVASGIATGVVYEQLRAVLPEINTGAEDKETGYSVGSIAIKSAIELANQTIFQASKAQPECAGMGTTIVVALFYDDRMSIAHVGDSRVYRLRGKKFDQVTKDHSLIQELVDKGFYDSVDEAEAAGNKNLITRALGVEKNVQVDVYEGVVRADDIYLLCSDGLTDMVSDKKIHLTLNEFSANLKLASEKLIAIANENGGKDNISVALARPTKSFAIKKSWYGRFF